MRSPPFVFSSVRFAADYLGSVWCSRCSPQEVRLLSLLAHLLLLSISGYWRKYNPRALPAASTCFSAPYWRFLGGALHTECAYSCRAFPGKSFFFVFHKNSWLRSHSTYIRIHLLSLNDFLCASFWNSSTARYPGFRPASGAASLCESSSLFSCAHPGDSWGILSLEIVSIPPLCEGAGNRLERVYPTPALSWSQNSPFSIHLFNVHFSTKGIYEE